MRSHQAFRAVISLYKDQKIVTFLEQGHRQKVNRYLNEYSILLLMSCAVFLFERVEEK